MADFLAHDEVRFTRGTETLVGRLQYRYVNNPSWLVHVPERGEMWVEEHELERVRDSDPTTAI